MSEKLTVEIVDTTSRLGAANGPPRAPSLGGTEVQASAPSPGPVAGTEVQAPAPSLFHGVDLNDPRAYEIDMKTGRPVLSDQPVAAPKSAVATQTAELHPHETAKDLLARLDQAKEVQEELNKLRAGRGQATEGNSARDLLGHLGLGRVGDLLPKSLQGLAVAAAPVGIALGAAKLATDALAGAMHLAGQQVEALGQATAKVVGNDYFGALQSEVGRVKGAFDALPLGAGKLGSAMIDLVNGPVKGFHDVLESFTGQADRLAPFSPDIINAQVRGTLTNLFDDIKESQQLGPGLGRLIDAETNLQHELRDVFLPMKAAILEEIAPVLEGMADFIRAHGAEIKALLVKLVEVVAAGPKGAMAIWNAVPNALKEVSQKLGLIEEHTKPKDAKGPEYFLEQLFNNSVTTTEADRAWRAHAPPGRGGFPGLGV